MNAPEAGVIKELLVKEEDTVTVGQEIAKIEPGAEATGEAPTSSESKQPAVEEKSTTSEKEPPGESKEGQPPPQEKKEESPKPSPEPTATASPPKQETTQLSKPPPKAPEPPKQEPRQTPSQPALGSRDERRVKMNRMRLRIAERLKQSQNTAASLTTFNEVDMSSMMEFRKLYKDEVLKKTGVKLGFMSAFSRACILAMKDVPAVNASIEGPDGGDTIVYRDYVDVSVAVATEKGLVTPVVRNAESLDLVGIEKAIADLGKKVDGLHFAIVEASG